MSEQLTVESIFANLHNFRWIADLIERDPERARALFANGGCHLNIEQLQEFAAQMKTRFGECENETAKS